MQTIRQLTMATGIWRCDRAWYWKARWRRKKNSISLPVKSSESLGFARYCRVIGGVRRHTRQKRLRAWRTSDECLHFFRNSGWYCCWLVWGRLGMKRLELKWNGLPFMRWAELPKTEQNVSLARLQDKRQYEVKTWKVLTSRSNATLARLEQTSVTLSNLLFGRSSVGKGHRKLFTSLHSAAKAFEE